MPDRIPPPMTGPASRTHPHEEGENLDRMVFEIVAGVAKADSRTIHNAEDSETWDILAVQIAEIKAAGHEVVLDNGA